MYEPKLEFQEGNWGAGKGFGYFAEQLIIYAVCIYLFAEQSHSKPGQGSKKNIRNERGNTLLSYRKCVQCTCMYVGQCV